jgi:maltose alpha-D-glucosyltransferase/alpha-amylase
MEPGASEQLPEFVTMVIRAGQTGPTPENVRCSNLKCCRRG